MRDFRRKQNIILLINNFVVIMIRNAAEPTEDNKPAPRPKGFRPLYDIPWMFEAREFLRKRLIGKRVQVIVDYIQTAKDNRPEKVCCTVLLAGR